MAASIPKQRFKPRATLYSPPPSHTRKLRVVVTRPSPGSSRSMTSPRLTMSQRQFVFGLATKKLISHKRTPQPFLRLYFSGAPAIEGNGHDDDCADDDLLDV